MSILGTDLFGDNVRQSAGVVAGRFILPPFTILDSKSGAWQERKAAWLSLGIKGEAGRDAKAYDIHQWMNDRETGRNGVGTEGFAGDGQSIFDPVLCELVYKWFSGVSGQVVDPFAGGSVRGIVAGILGRKYWGCDLRQEQIIANNDQINSVDVAVSPIWICGDSMTELDNAPDADLIFSCPPYGDLEKYSDDSADLSNMEWHTFLAAYKRIILRSSQKLKNNRFACFVVGEFRDKKGFYRNFVGETVSAFLDCGLRLYNEAILETSVGSAAMRVTKQFSSGRKMAKTHQNVLVFCKGDWKVAAQSCEQFVL